MAWVAGKAATRVQRRAQSLILRPRRESRARQGAPGTEKDKRRGEAGGPGVREGARDRRGSREGRGDPPYQKAQAPALLCFLGGTGGLAGARQGREAEGRGPPLFWEQEVRASEKVSRPPAVRLLSRAPLDPGGTWPWPDSRHTVPLLPFPPPHSHSFCRVVLLCAPASGGAGGGAPAPGGQPGGRRQAQRGGGPAVSALQRALKPHPRSLECP